MAERTMDPSEWYRDPDPPEETLVATVVSHEDGPRECTLFPPDLPDEAVLTTWMTAREGSFVPLDEAR